MVFTAQLFLLAAFTACGVLWQYRVYLADQRTPNYPLRVRAAVIVAVWFFIGLVVYGIIALGLDTPPFSFRQFLFILLRAMLILGLLIFKSYFGPFLSCFSLAVFIYFWSTHGDIYFWKLVQPAFNWAFSNLPQPVEMFYKLSLFFVILGGSIVDSSRLME